VSEPILSLRGINKSFGPVDVLKGVNLDAYAGEVTALVGDNGAGKSTLIKCIAGIYTPESGEVFFEGKKVTVTGPRDATALGIEVVYQDLALCDNLDIVQNMFLGREVKNGITLNETNMESLARKTLDGLSVRTVKSTRQLVASLSGGQRQTVAIARAVLWNSKVVILDEPTAGVDAKATHTLLEFISRIHEERHLTTLLVTHDLALVRKHAQHVIWLHEGKVLYGTTQELLSPEHMREIFEMEIS
jgi:D-xylose transport system ATP-binding protein